MSAPPGGYGPRPGFDDERTPVRPHAAPAPVVVRAGTAPKGPPPLPPRATPRTPTPKGGTLAPLGVNASLVPVPGPEVFTTDERPTERNSRQAIFDRHLRVCRELPIEDLRLVAALALRLYPGIGE